MMNWVETLVHLQQQAIPAVMVTVASTVGSTPREPGAKMIVTSSALFGTIGGGNLEYKACAIARTQLETDQPGQLRRFPLGAGLGQCCGGLVNLMFEPIVENTSWLEIAQQFQASGEDWIRVVSAHDSSVNPNAGFLVMNRNNLHNAFSEQQTDTGLIPAAESILNADTRVDLLQTETGGESYFIEATRKSDFRLVLFGAGHVGQAIVRVLEDLPIQIHWVDTREDQLIPEIPANVEFICTDSPEAEVDAAAASSFFLVMTHDHALDQRLAEQILKRNDFTYFGLIGSASKRRMFETRMSRRGFTPSDFAGMTCPIGGDGISSKAPAAIAISVAGELLQVYDQSVSANNNKQRLGRAR